MKDNKSLLNFFHTLYYQFLVSRFPDLKMYSHMLVEDIQIRVIPYDSYDSPTFSVNLSNGKLGDQLEICNAIKPNSSRDLKDCITEFIREMAQYLAVQGKVYYRIIYTGDTKQRFEFLRLHNEEVLPIFGYNFVLHKPNYRLNRANLKLGKVVCFKLPSEIQGLPKLLKEISKVDPGGLPEFAMDYYDPTCPMSERVYVDHKHIIRREQTTLGKLTRNIGWSGRRLLSDRMTEYFEIYRALIFKKFLIKIRENILMDLNRMLSIASKDLGTTLSISIDGLPTEEDVFHAIDKLEKGSASFSDLLEQNLLL